MSRVGKMPVTVPQGVDVSINSAQISVKGSGGTLSVAAHALVKVVNEAGQVTFTPVDDSREANAMSGTLRQCRFSCLASHFYHQHGQVRDQSEYCTIAGPALDH